MLIVADPQAAKKRCDEGVEARRVEGRQFDDGTAMLAGYGLPPQQAAAAYERMDAMAKAARAGGDPRTMDQLRADVFLGLLDGSYAGPGPQDRRGVVELTVPLPTLLGLSDEPGELAGWGPVVADIARQVADQRHEQAQGPRWRFSVLDPRTGRVVHHGSTRRRPTKPQRDRVAARDRRCITPGCRMPARRCQYDHTDEYQHGGKTEDDNLGLQCVHHHGLKTKRKVRVVQIHPGMFAWTTALGHTRYTGPEPPYG